MNPYDQIPAASPAAVGSAEELYNSISKTFPGAVTDFEAKWEAWQKTWFSANSASSNTFHYYEVPEFDNLVALGPKIIPLVVHKLASSSRNFPGVNLYNELEQDKDYLVDPNDVLNYNVLQRQANLIVDLNYRRNKLAQARIAAWQAHCRHNWTHSSPLIFTDCDEYDKLVELGPSIIAHLMLAYAETRAGFWYELLHETICGRGKKMRLVMPDLKEQYAAWSEWFQEEEHDQWPEWTNVIWPQAKNPATVAKL